MIFKFLFPLSKKILKACSKGDAWLFQNVKRLEYFTGVEVYSVTVYGEHKSKCMGELVFIIRQKLKKKNVVIKKEQGNFNQMALVFKVMINAIRITCIF